MSRILLSVKKRAFCFTINNYTSGDELLLKSLGEKDNVKYLCYGYEVAPTTGTIHLQGYVRFNDVQKPGKVLKMLPHRAHMETCTGSPIQNYKYCSKTRDVDIAAGVVPNIMIEFGVRPKVTGSASGRIKGGEANKKRWEIARQQAKDGQFDSISSDIFIKHFDSIHRINTKYGGTPSDLVHPSSEKVNFWIYGPTGTGKSWFARRSNPDAHLKAADNKWWDGYHGQKVSIIEDFDKYHVKQGYQLKIWADRYAFPAEMKGSMSRLRPEVVIVTSNYHPREIWDDDQTYQPIMRRFRLIRYLGADEVPDPFVDYHYDELRVGYVEPIVNTV